MPELDERSSEQAPSAAGARRAGAAIGALTAAILWGWQMPDPVLWGCVVALLLIVLLHKAPLNYGELAYPEEAAPATGGES